MAAAAAPPGRKGHPVLVEAAPPGEGGEPPELCASETPRGGLEGASMPTTRAATGMRTVITGNSEGSSVQLTAAPSDGGRGEAAGKVQIICVGVMRTGLKTLHKALRVLGHSRIYDQEDIISTFELWNDVMRNRATRETFMNIFQGAQVVIGMPTFCFWERILDCNPDAKVILTVRDEDEWWDSAQRAKSLVERDLPGAPLSHGPLMRTIERFLVPSYHNFCEVLRFVWCATLGTHALIGEMVLNEDVARSNYRKHNAYVQSTLSGRRTSRGEPQLLVYDVREGWEPLCEFLGHEVPQVDFPSVLRVPYFPGQGQGHQGQNGGGGGGAAGDCASDFGCEFEELLIPESAFGYTVRRELRRGLAAGMLGLVLAVAPMLAVVHQYSVITVSPTMVALACFALFQIGWSTYIVMHSLVMKVPALVVLPLVVKSLLIAASIQVCFIPNAILKEQIVTQDRIASPVLILATRLLSVLCAGIALLLVEGRISFGGAPLASFFYFGFTNEAATWSSFELLKYLSFPVQVMAKSCKLLPNMIMGKVLNGEEYQWWQYVQAVGAMVCVTIMHLSDEKESTGPDDQMTELSSLFIGVMLLVMFFVCDSFTSQWQNALYRKHPTISKLHMMMAGNIVGVIISLGSAVSRWKHVSESLAVAFSSPAVMGRILCLGLSGAMGQFCIYNAIKVLGALAFTWIMTARQLLSVLISLVMFGHGVSVTKLVCIVTTFAIMSSGQISRAMPHAINALQVVRRRSSNMAFKAKED